MGLRNLLLILFGGLLLSSCDTEEKNSSGNEMGRDTSFSIMLTLGEVNAMTKAGDIAEGYLYSTADEVNVNNAVVAVFSETTQGSVGECLDYKSIQVNDASKTSVVVDGKTLAAYKIDDILAKTGKVRIVVIANSTQYDELAKLNTITYEALKGLTEEVAAGTFDAKNLVKVGELPYFDLNQSVSSISVPLTQLAARIDMKFEVDEDPVLISKTDYSQTSDQWFFSVTKLTVKNINQKSDLILFDRGNQYDSPLVEEKVVMLKNGVALPFYTYEKLNTTNSPISISVTGDLQKRPVTINYNDMSIRNVTQGDVTEEEKGRSFKYENFNPTTALEGCKTNGIIHGNRYELTGRISLKTQRINFTISTTPWEGVEKFIVDVVIADLKYLFVRETKVVMANVTEYKIEFVSSSDVTVNMPEYATYEEYYLLDNKITKRKGTYYPNDYYDNKWTDDNKHKKDQYPKIIAEGKQGFIMITSVLPVNYFPKNFEFGVSNSDGLSVKGIVIDQYPPQYLEGKVSCKADPEDAGSDGTTNPNIFTITVKATGGLIVGNPSIIKDGVVVTNDDIFSAEIISPKFVVASRFGAVTTGTYTYAQAVERCKVYGETLDDGTTYGAGKWRVPTLAELEFMNTVQDASPAVNYLFNTDGTYWSAMPYYYYDFGKNKRNSFSSSDSKAGGIRCVRDLY